MTKIRPKVLITGGGGLLGQYLNNSVSVDYDILTLYRSKIGNCIKFNSRQVDIIDFALLSGCISQFEPDYIIHCAAVSNPNKADDLNNDEVYTANVTATEIIAQGAAEVGAKLLYTSTDLVYDGDRGSYLKEEAKLMPLTLYAETKLMGEEKIRRSFNNYIIARVPLLFGYGNGGKKNNFVAMIESFMKGERVRLFSDQFRTPLSVRETAAIITRLLKTEFNNEIINLSSSRRVSRVEIGELACGFGDFDKSLINSVSMSSVPDLISVADVSLNISRLRSRGIEPALIETMIEEEVNFMKTNCNYLGTLKIE